MRSRLGPTSTLAPRWAALAAAEGAGKGLGEGGAAGGRRGRGRRGARPAALPVWLCGVRRSYPETPSYPILSYPMLELT